MTQNVLNPTLNTVLSNINLLKHLPGNSTWSLSVAEVEQVKTIVTGLETLYAGQTTSNDGSGVG